MADNLSDFERALKTAAEKSLLKIIADGRWIETNYADRFKVPADMLAKVYSLVDADAIARRMAARLNEELADRIVNHMAAEIATDVKQLLSDKERREALRAIARQHIDNVCKLGEPA